MNIDETQGDKMLDLAAANLRDVATADGPGDELLGRTAMAMRRGKRRAWPVAAALAAGVLLPLGVLGWIAIYAGGEGSLKVIQPMFVMTDVPHSQSLVLKPGVGIGDLRFGATRQEVTAMLGEPQDVARVGTTELMEYPTAGLTLCVNPVSGLDSVNTHGSWPFTKASQWQEFTGSTDKSIRIGSTRDEVESVYGRDYDAEVRPLLNHPEIHVTQLLYGKSGLLVNMDALTDRVQSISLAAPTPKMNPTMVAVGQDTILIPTKIPANRATELIPTTWPGETGEVIEIRVEQATRP